MKLMPVTGMKYLMIICMAASIFTAAVSCTRAQESPFEKDLQRIDEVISRADDYMDIKEQRISTIENMLHSRGVTPLQQYHIYGELYDEYVAYQFDKAKDALDNQLKLADEIGKKALRHDSMIKKAHLLTTAGYYHEADALFGQIDTTSLDSSQMVDWYMARQKFLSDYNEYVSSAGFAVEDYDKVPYYQAEIVRGLPEGSYYSRHIEILSLIYENRYREASGLNISLIESLNKDSRDYAVQTYWQGKICELQGNAYEAIYWWTESAICDIKGAIKDNASLSTLASKLINPQDADRAFRYIRFSLDDATFYNAKLRKVQLATSFPAIEKAYTDSKLSQERDRVFFIGLLGAVALLLAFFCMLAIRMYFKDKASADDIRKKNQQLLLYTKSIEEAENNLRKTNLDLVEANAAKEEYLGLFLSMCSGYLDKLKKTLPRDQYEAELKNFYKTFDTSFIKLYPTFVEDFNSLLKEDQRISLKDGEMLNTELRIFALIKLGINQSSHIASLLRYSVNTIYNYRAQIKNAVQEDRENFEEMVKKIGSRQ